jgi:uncharacterized protein (DUF433 family)
MEVSMTAIEMTGTVDENHQLKLDGELPIAGPKRVRVIVLSPPEFPHIEIAKFTGGYSTVIRGTRVMVSTIIEYLLMGETPETITKNILPHLTLPQIEDAQKYYSYYKDEIDKERSENTEEAGRKYLRESLGEEGYRKITGQ